jgi:hypothetical protein
VGGGGGHIRFKVAHGGVEELEEEEEEVWDGSVGGVE